MLRETISRLLVDLDSITEGNADCSRESVKFLAVRRIEVAGFINGDDLEFTTSELLAANAVQRAD